MIKTYIINLKKDTKRWNTVSELVKGSKLEVTRFNAIYGKELSMEQINERTNIICKSLLCNHAIIGCASSHYYLWKKLLNEKEDYFLILEDDIVKIDFDKLYKLDGIIKRKELDWEVISLYNIGLFLKKGNIYEKEIIIEDKLFPLSAAGYFINKDGLKKLVDFFDLYKIMGHVDFIMALNKYTNNLKLYNVDNIIESSTLESNINTMNNNMSFSLLEYLNLYTIKWMLNVPIFVINLKYEIKFYHLIILLILLINYNTINNPLIYLYIIIDLLQLYL